MKKTWLKYSDELKDGKLFNYFKSINDTVNEANRIIKEYKKADNKHDKAKKEQDSRYYSEICYNLSKDFEKTVKEYNKHVDEFMDIPVTIAYNNSMDYIACVFDGNINNINSCVSYVSEDTFKDAYKTKFRYAYNIMGVIGYNTIIEPESLCNMTYEQPLSHQPIHDIRQFLDGFSIRYGMFQLHEVDIEHAQEIADEYKFVEEQNLSGVDDLEKHMCSNSTFNEDKFLLDYIEWQKGNMHISDYAKKYNMTVWELQDKLREHRFSISNLRR